MSSARTLGVAGMGFLLLAVVFNSPVFASTNVVNDCPDASGILSSAIDLPSTNPSYPLTVAYTQSSNTFTFTVTTPTTDSGQGIIEYCVFPTSGGVPTGSIPAGTTESTTVVEGGHAWTAGTDCSSGCVDSIRSDGNPADIPYDGATTTALTVDWGTVPAGFIIVLHILDGTICGGGIANPGTCFVIPNGSHIFPPPPPPPGVPQFPLGLLLIVAVAVPALLLVRRRQLQLVA
jgi:hypothetical protein